MGKYPEWFRYRVSKFTVSDRTGHPAWDMLDEVNKQLIERGVDATDIISIEQYDPKRHLGHVVVSGSTVVFYREKNSA